MMLQFHVQTEKGTEYEVLKDSVSSIHFYHKNELLVHFKDGGTETYYVDDDQIHTMYLLNDEGKTLRVLWRRLKVDGKYIK